MATRKPKGTPTGGEFAESARAESGVDLSTSTDKPRKRTVVPEHEWYGWATGVKVVEVEVLQRAGKNGGYTVQAVYADGVHIGHIVGRNESANSKRRWWDYVVGTKRPDSRTFTGMVFGNDSRQIVISNLTSAAQRK